MPSVCTVLYSTCIPYNLVYCCTVQYTQPIPPQPAIKHPGLDGRRRGEVDLYVDICKL
jgi:hypothetical protein